MQVQEWLIERQQLLERINELEAENAELRKRLGEDVMSIEKKTTATQNLSLQEKVDLFITLFNGHEDVFARRVVQQDKWESWLPACVSGYIDIWKA